MGFSGEAHEEVPAFPDGGMEWRSCAGLAFDGAGCAEYEEGGDEEEGRDPIGQALHFDGRAIATASKDLVHGSRMQWGCLEFKP